MAAHGMERSPSTVVCDTPELVAMFREKSWHNCADAVQKAGVTGDAILEMTPEEILDVCVGIRRESLWKIIDSLEHRMADYEAAAAKSSSQESLPSSNQFAKGSDMQGQDEKSFSKPESAISSKQRTNSGQRLSNSITRKRNWMKSNKPEEYWDGAPAVQRTGNNSQTTTTQIEAAADHSRNKAEQAHDAGNQQAQDVGNHAEHHPVPTSPNPSEAKTKSSGVASPRKPPRNFQVQAVNRVIACNQAMKAFGSCPNSPLTRVSPGIGENGLPQEMSNTAIQSEGSPRSPKSARKLSRMSSKSSLWSHSRRDTTEDEPIQSEGSPRSPKVTRKLSRKSSKSSLWSYGHKDTEDEPELEQSEWFHPRCNLEDVTNLLSKASKDGAFFVMPSQASFKNLMLNVWHNNDVHQLRILWHKSSSYLLCHAKEEDVVHASVQQLIDHHTEQPIHLTFGSKIRLTKPCTAHT
eukprot:scpid85810/ scgid12660/ 